MVANLLGMKKSIKVPKIPFLPPWKECLTPPSSLNSSRFPGLLRLALLLCASGHDGGSLGASSHACQFDNHSICSGVISLGV